MAGAETEVELLSHEPQGDGFDREQIAFKMDEAPYNMPSEARLRRMTKMLVRRHRVLIERVAEALLSKTTLSGSYIDELVGRSINDVKPNLPDDLRWFNQGPP